MANAIATFTDYNYPNGTDLSGQRRQINYGTVAVTASAAQYVQGGVRINFASLEKIKSTSMLPIWLEAMSTSGSGYQYAFNPNGPTITNLALTSNVVTITAKNNLAAGDVVILTGLTTTAALNGTVLTVLSGSLTATAFTANLTHGNISTAAETGFCNIVSYASGLPFQGNLQIFTGAAAQSSLAELSTGATPAAVSGDQINFRAEFLKG